MKAETEAEVSGGVTRQTLRGTHTANGLTFPLRGELKRRIHEATPRGGRGEQLNTVTTG